MKVILRLLLLVVIAMVGSPAKTETANFAEAAGELSAPSTTIKSGRCYVALNPGDQVLFDGPCSIAVGKSGAFSFGGFPFTAIRNHAVFVAANASPPSAVLDVLGWASDLGSVARDGDCWVNDKVKICVWEDGSKGEAWIYDEPGTSGGPYVEPDLPMLGEWYHGDVPRSPDQGDWVLDLMPPPVVVTTPPPTYDRKCYVALRVR